MSIPWASGPGELLQHGLNLLKTDSDSNRRIAMISIDNSVELMVKTYLGLPQRINQLKIPRREYQEICESFPSLLDALEKYASDKIAGINLGEIEWYHRLRNELYHQGNGLTVEKNNVTVYAELANILFEKLFGEKLVETKDFSSVLLGEFMSLWIELEKMTQPYLINGGKDNKIYFNNPQVLFDKGVLSKNQIENYNHIKKIRNEVVHGKIKAEDYLNNKIIEELKDIIEVIKNSKYDMSKES